MIEYSQSKLQWEIVPIAAYLTQWTSNTQQAIAYPSEKQDKSPKTGRTNQEKKHHLLVVAKIEKGVL